jgi:hypothetical protein
MRSLFPLHPSSPVKSEGMLERYLGQPFSTADYILLCCFGTELQGQRTHQELHQALIQSGFTGPLVRHLISVSPVVRRAANRGYCIRKFADDPGW